MNTVQRLRLRTAGSQWRFDAIGGKRASALSKLRWRRCCRDNVLLLLLVSRSVAGLRGSRCIVKAIQSDYRPAQLLIARCLRSEACLINTFHMLFLDIDIRRHPTKHYGVMPLHPTSIRVWMLFLLIFQKISKCLLIS